MPELLVASSKDDGKHIGGLQFLRGNTTTAASSVENGGRRSEVLDSRIIRM
jgi:hypothetical protein